jgi:hypothetical protein
LFRGENGKNEMDEVRGQWIKQHCYEHDDLYCYRVLYSGQNGKE